MSYVVTVTLLVLLNFALPRTLPGDPVSRLEQVGAVSGGNPVAKEELGSYYGLDQPLLQQFGGYVSDLAQGDLGTSIRYGTPVAELIADRLGWTLLLVGTALTLAALAGLPAGVHSGWRRARMVDRSLLAAFIAVRNFPVYFLASLALAGLAAGLGWFPIAGARTPFAQLSPQGQIADVAWHLALPATVLAVQFAATHYLLMRAGMVGQLGADYLVLGRSKGLKERRLKYRHAARNALLTVVTLIGLQVGFTVSGAIFVETVFAYPGMGRLLFEAVAFRDYPILQGCFLVLSFVVVSANFAVDALHARLDPRVAS